MKRLPEIKFLVSSPGCVGPPDAGFLETPVPLTRPGAADSSQEGPTYGSYLEGIKQLLVAHMEQFLEAVAQSAGNDEDVRCLDIVVEKHGSDYHPARIRAHLDKGYVSLVANVALTERGARRLARDFHLLDSFARDFREHLVPKVYCLIEPSGGETNPPNPVLRMFIGEWLSGYHEFHLTRSSEAGEPEVVVWDLEHSPFMLAPDKVRQLFRKAAFVLTYYYDVDHFREIFPWHHASGDFVVQASARDVDVKLITVRQYGNRIDFPENSSDHSVPACLAFLANLTLRMRLDRFDGTGEVAWAGEMCVEETVQGFVDALRVQVGEGRCRPEFLKEVFCSIENMSLTDLTELFRDVVESYDQDAPDIEIIRENLVEHIFSVASVLVELVRNG
jgi:hypothetical protein